MKKYWVVPDVVLQQVKRALGAAAHEGNAGNCQEYTDWPPGSECSGCVGDDERSAAHKALDLNAVNFSEFILKLDK